MVDFNSLMISYWGEGSRGSQTKTTAEVRNKLVECPATAGHVANNFRKTSL